MQRQRLNVLSFMYKGWLTVLNTVKVKIIVSNKIIRLFSYRRPTKWPYQNYNSLHKVKCNF